MAGSVAPQASTRTRYDIQQCLPTGPTAAGAASARALLSNYAFLPSTTGRADRKSGSNCRGGRSSSIERSDWTRGTAFMMRWSKANGRRGSCAASRKISVSRNRHHQALRQLGGGGRFSLHRRAKCSLSPAIRTIP